MAKLNKNHKEEEGGETWLLSYADMMTLIACFFILMMAFANFDPAGFSKKTKVISTHFSKKDTKSSDLKLKHLQEEVSRHPNIKTMAKITKKNGELAISFSGSAVFNKNSYALSKQAIKNLNIMIEIILEMNPNYKIIAQGHADKTEGRSKTIALSVWSLSGARAGAVIERFEFHGVKPTQLSAVGLGDTEPLFPSFDEEGNPLIDNQRMNQRVIIKLLTPQPKNKKKIKLGLGVYFPEEN